MKLNEKIRIDFLDFIKTGKFDYIKLGQTKEWILNNFPDPDYFSEDFLLSKYTIWTYGNLEFHFDQANELFLIYSDYLHELEGGESLQLNKWILEDYSKLTLVQVLAQLNKEEIDYTKSSDRFGVQVTAESGVTCHFMKDSDSVADINQVQMTAFSFRQKA